MYTHNFTTKLIAIIILMASLFSCSTPLTKESYVEKFESFIEKISNEHSSFTKRDWQKADEKFDKFDNEWYKKFEEELTWKEYLTVKKLKTQYYYYSGKESAKTYWNKYLKDDYTELRKELEYYIENDMDEDVDAVMDQAKILGDSAMIIVEDIIEEIEVRRK